MATHFHQLAEFCRQLPSSGCYKLVAEKDKEGIIFTYQIKVSKLPVYTVLVHLHVLINGVMIYILQCIKRVIYRDELSINLKCMDEI